MTKPQLNLTANVNSSFLVVLTGASGFILLSFAINSLTAEVPVAFPVPALDRGGSLQIPLPAMQNAAPCPHTQQAASGSHSAVSETLLYLEKVMAPLA